MFGMLRAWKAARNLAALMCFPNKAAASCGLRWDETSVRLYPSCIDMALSTRTCSSEVLGDIGLVLEAGFPGEGLMCAGRGELA